MMSAASAPWSPPPASGEANLASSLDDEKKGPAPSCSSSDLPPTPPTIPTSLDIPTFSRLLAYLSSIPSSPPSSLAAQLKLAESLSLSLPPPSAGATFYRACFQAFLDSSDHSALAGFLLLPSLLPCLLQPPGPTVARLLSSLSDFSPPPGASLSSFCALVLSIINTTVSPLTDSSLAALISLASSLPPSVLTSVRADARAAVAALPPSPQRDYVDSILSAPADSPRPPPPPPEEEREERRDEKGRSLLELQVRRLGIAGVACSSLLFGSRSSTERPFNAPPCS